MATPQMLISKRDREPRAGEMETHSCITLGSQEDKNGMVCLDTDSGPRGAGFFLCLQKKIDWSWELQTGQSFNKDLSLSPTVFELCLCKAAGC